MSFCVGRRGAAYCAAAGLFLIAAPVARAQDSKPAQSQTPSAAQLPDMPGLDPQSPLAPLPDLGVDWPDLAAAPADSVPADANPAYAAEPASTELVGEARYAYAVEGIDDAASSVLRQRFDQLSSLKANDGEPAQCRAD